MQKRCLLCCPLLALILSACGTIYNIYNKDNDETVDPAEYISLIKSNSFDTGFNLIKNRVVTDPVLDITKLDYNGEANGAESEWILSHWFRAEEFEMSQSTFTKMGEGHYLYSNESRILEVDSSQKSLRMMLDTGVEYEHLFEHRKNDLYATEWSHFLIENYFDGAGTDTSIKLGKVNSIPISFDLTINECTFNGEELTNIEKEGALGAAQLFLYFSVVYNPNNLYKHHNNAEHAVWIGMPLFDSRYNVISKYVNIDDNHVGASNRLIYSASNADYLPVSNWNGLEYGRKYSVKYDILPLIQEAYIYACNLDKDEHPNTSFKGLDYSDFQLGYMNYGYECPGAFKIDTTISNFDVRYN